MWFLGPNAIIKSRTNSGFPGVKHGHPEVSAREGSDVAVAESRGLSYVTRRVYEVVVRKLLVQESHTPGPAMATQRDVSEHTSKFRRDRYLEIQLESVASDSVEATYTTSHTPPTANRCLLHSSPGSALSNRWDTPRPSIQTARNIQYGLGSKARPIGVRRGLTR